MQKISSYDIFLIFKYKHIFGIIIMVIMMEKRIDELVKILNLYMKIQSEYSLTHLTSILEFSKMNIHNPLVLYHKCIQLFQQVSSALYM